LVGRSPDCGKRSSGGTNSTSSGALWQAGFNTELACRKRDNGMTAPIKTKVAWPARPGAGYTAEEAPRHVNDTIGHHRRIRFDRAWLRPQTTIAGNFRP